MRKFESNVARDRLVGRNLKKLGWTVVVAWECETANPDKLANRFRKVLKRDPLSRTKSIDMNTLSG